MALFKKFSRDDISSSSQVKASVARGIRASIGQQFPWLEDHGVLDVLIPKKEAIVLGKMTGHVQVVLVNNAPLFFQERDGPWLPVLRILHQYPDMMPKLRVDKGAIKFVLQGANIMCPGLTSAGATIEDEVDANTAVAIFAEGKEHALAVGVTKMSTKEIREINKGSAVDNLHHLADGLWKSPVLT